MKRFRVLRYLASPAAPGRHDGVGGVSLCFPGAGIGKRLMRRAVSEQVILTLAPEAQPAPPGTTPPPAAGTCLNSAIGNQKFGTSPQMRCGSHLAAA
jgi:hypothetical protein